MSENKSIFLSSIHKGPSLQSKLSAIISISASFEVIESSAGSTLSILPIVLYSCLQDKKMQRIEIKIKIKITSALFIMSYLKYRCAKKLAVKIRKDFLYVIVANVRLTS